MWIIYDLIIHLYGDVISIAALFNPKARKWVAGRKGIYKELSSQFAVRSSQSAPSPKSPPPIGGGDIGVGAAWFHCASLGEFEQGRPVIEAFRKEHPDWKIMLTFPIRF